MEVQPAKKCLALPQGLSSLPTSLRDATSSLQIVCLYDSDCQKKHCYWETIGAVHVTDLILFYIILVDGSAHRYGKREDIAARVPLIAHSACLMASNFCLYGESKCRRRQQVSLGAQAVPRCMLRPGDHLHEVLEVLGCILRYASKTFSTSQGQLIIVAPAASMLAQANPTPGPKNA